MKFKNVLNKNLIFWNVISKSCEIGDNFYSDPDAGPPVIPLTDPDAPDPNAPPPQSEDSASTTRFIFLNFYFFLFLGCLVILRQSVLQKQVQQMRRH